MDYHENGDDQNEKGHKKGILSHGILMLLCCMIPIALLLALPYLNIKSPAMQAVLSGGIFLLCPLMHVGMMFFMSKGNKKEDKNDGNKSCH